MPSWNASFGRVHTQLLLTQCRVLFLQWVPGSPESTSRSLMTCLNDYIYIIIFCKMSPQKLEGLAGFESKTGRTGEGSPKAYTKSRLKYLFWRPVATRVLYYHGSEDKGMNILINIKAPLSTRGWSVDSERIRQNTFLPRMQSQLVEAARADSELGDMMAKSDCLHLSRNRNAELWDQ